jgi:hypothetical protein
MTELSPDNFSKTDFKTILEASYLPQKKAAEYVSKIGYSYDPELSTMQTKVFIDPSGRPVISNRGSVTAKDWLVDDLNIATGGFFKTPRIKESEKLAKATQEKYGMAPTYASHSLGGYLSEQAAKKTPGSQVYTYNKASGLPSVFYERPKSQTDYRTALDIPSALSAFQSGGTSKTLMGNLFSPIASHDIKYLK